MEAGGGTPIASSSSFSWFNFYSTCLRIPGSDRLMASTSCSESLLVKDLVPITLSGRSLYSAWELKNLISFLSATSTGTLFLISYWALFTIPIYPSFKNISSFINIFLALVPLSMISIFVITPIVLSPFGSHSLANFRPSEVDKSWLAGITQRIIVLGSMQYLLAIYVVIFSTSFWPFTSILVIPGKSIIVKSGQSTENTFSLMGSSTIFDYVPAISSVNFWMLSLTWVKSVYFLPSLSPSNIAYGLPSECPELLKIYLGPCEPNEAQEDVGWLHLSL